MYTSTFGVTIPPLNYHLILLSYIESLSLPLQIYQTVKFLNTILKFSFAYPISYARLTALSHPETQLMTLVVIATKLLFPFPSSHSTSAKIPTYAYSLNDPSAMTLNWNIWLTAKRTYDAALISPYTTTLIPGTEMSIKDTDILQMEESQLDAYMDFYQEMWVNPDRKEEGVGKRILDMFPLTPLQSQDGSDNGNVEGIAARERKEEEKGGKN